MRPRTTSETEVNKAGEVVSSLSVRDAASQHINAGRARRALRTAKKNIYCPKLQFHFKPYLARRRLLWPRPIYLLGLTAAASREDVRLQTHRLFKQPSGDVSNYCRTNWFQQGGEVSGKSSCSLWSWTGWVQNVADVTAASLSHHESKDGWHHVCLVHLPALARRFLSYFSLSWFGSVVSCKLSWLLSCMKVDVLDWHSK